MNLRINTSVAGFGTGRKVCWWWVVVIWEFSVLLWSKPFTFKLKIWIWTKPNNINLFHNVGSKLIFLLARAHHCVKLFIVNLSITIQVSFINHDLEREHFEMEDKMQGFVHRQNLLLNTFCFVLNPI